MYEIIYDFSNLLVAHKKVTKSNKNKLTSIRHFYFLENNLLRLSKLLFEENYIIKPYKHFIVIDPKRRQVSAPAFEDRIVQHSLVSVIEPIFDKTFIEDDYACRKNKGTHYALKRLKKFLQSARTFYGKDKDVFVLKCDVKKFFSSISWDVLLEIVFKKVRDEKTANLIKKFVTTYSQFHESGDLKACQQNLFEEKKDEPPVSVHNRTGLPIGNLTSQLFANVYMNELDQFVKRKLKERWYGRYMDDFFIISGDKDHLKQIKIEINNFLKNRLKLNLHPKKSFIQNVKYGVCFVGYRIFYDHILINGSTLRRFQKKYARKLKRYKSGKISKDDLNRCQQSFCGHMKHANAYWLRKKMFGE